ncbi:unnamed protein product [Ilex paraguariensis]|uniref:Uncharacterized protein n=1 Tax=Ilex paraguariensis TaxID=185542 RepID=A0ABC8UKX5_9AQUA
MIKELDTQDGTQSNNYTPLQYSQKVTSNPTANCNIKVRLIITRVGNSRHNPQNQYKINTRLVGLGLSELGGKRVYSPDPGNKWVDKNQLNTACTDTNLSIHASKWIMHGLKKFRSEKIYCIKIRRQIDIFNPNKHQPKVRIRKFKE